MEDREDGEDGALPLAVLLHGSPGGPGSWRQVVERLEAASPDIAYRTIAIPGWERTAPGDVEDLSYDELLAALAAQVPARPIVLFGFSAGGLLGLSLTARGLCDVRRLVLIDPMLFPLLDLAGFASEHEAVLAMMRGYLAAVDAGDPAAFEGVIDVWIGPGAYQRMSERTRDYLRSAGALNVRDVRATMAAAFSAHDFAAVTCPVIATWGGGGPAIWQRFTDSLRRLIPHTEVRTFAGADHDVLSTHPAEVAGLIATEIRAAQAHR